MTTNSKVYPLIQKGSCRLIGNHAFMLSDYYICHYIISFATIVSPKLAFQQKEKEKDSRYEAETDGYS